MGTTFLVISWLVQGERFEDEIEIEFLHRNNTKINLVATNRCVKIDPLDTFYGVCWC